MVFSESNRRMKNKVMPIPPLPDFTPAQQMTAYITGLLTMTWCVGMNGLMILNAMKPHLVSGPGGAGLGVHSAGGE